MLWKLFTSTFTLIFLAELPDKTFFANLIMATKHNPLAVFLGAAGAFVVQSAVAVLFGRVVSLLPHHIVHIAAGVLFLIFAGVTWFEEEELEEEIESGSRKIGKSFSGTAGAAFLMIFIAEWGDLTQLATATLVAHYGAPFTIFAASTLALWAVTGLAVMVGHHGKKFVKPNVLKKVAAGAFTLAGVFFLLKG